MRVPRCRPRRRRHDHDARPRTARRPDPRVRSRRSRSRCSTTASGHRTPTNSHGRGRPTSARHSSSHDGLEEHVVDDDREPATGERSDRGVQPGDQLARRASPVSIRNAPSVAASSGTYAEDLGPARLVEVATRAGRRRPCRCRPGATARAGRPGSALASVDLPELDVPLSRMMRPGRDARTGASSTSESLDPLLPARLELVRDVGERPGRADLLGALRRSRFAPAAPIATAVSRTASPTSISA